MRHVKVGYLLALLLVWQVSTLALPAEPSAPDYVYQVVRDNFEFLILCRADKGTGEISFKIPRRRIEAKIEEVSKPYEVAPDRVATKEIFDQEAKVAKERKTGNLLILRGMLHKPWIDSEQELEFFRVQEK